MEEDFLSLVRADASVTALLGNRINWIKRPQEDTIFPACVLQRVGGSVGYHSKAPDGLVDSRVQCDVWAHTYGAAKIAMRAIQAVISGHSGTVGGTVFQSVTIDSERDLSDEDQSINNQLFRVSADFRIWHR